MARHRLRGERVLVTGGAGFLGSHLVERLAPRNDVVVLDDLSTGSRRNLTSVASDVRLVRGSVLDGSKLDVALRGVDTVFHLAARTSIVESERRPGPYGLTNVLGTASLLQRSARRGVRRIVFASSAAVYGNTRALPVDEGVPPRPASTYAETKLAGEHLCLAADRANAIEATVVRIFNAYGPRQGADSPYAAVIPRFASLAAAGRQLPVYGTGRQTRDFVYVSDVADAMERAAVHRSARGKVLNLASGRETSVIDVVAVLQRVLDRPLRRVRRPRRSGEVLRSVASVARARAVLDWRAATSLEDGLRHVVADRRGLHPP